MPFSYTPTAAALPATVTLPSDSDARNAASVNPALESLADGVAWNSLIGSFFYSVKQYGAKGDGTTDDTTAVVNALNAIGSVTVLNVGGFVGRVGAVLLFPPGLYKLTSFNLPVGSITLMGAGASSTTIAFEVAGSPTSDGFISVGNSNVSFRDMTITSSGGAGVCRDLVSLSNGSWFSFYNCALNGAGRNGLYLGTASQVLVQNCNFVNCADTGAYLSAVQQANLTSSYFNANPTGCRLVGISQAVAFSGCAFANSQFYGLHGEGGTYSVVNGNFYRNVGADMFLGDSGLNSATVSVVNAKCDGGGVKNLLTGGVQLDNVVGGAVVGGDYAATSLPISFSANTKGVSILGPYVGAVVPIVGGATMTSSNYHGIVSFQTGSGTTSWVS